VRKRIEEAFGWIKTVGGLAKTKLIGQAKLSGQALLCFATYNLVRMGSLGASLRIHMSSIMRWRKGETFCLGAFMAMLQ